MNERMRVRVVGAVVAAACLMGGCGGDGGDAGSGGLSDEEITDEQQAALDDLELDLGEDEALPTLPDQETTTTAPVTGGGVLPAPDEIAGQPPEDVRELLGAIPDATLPSDSAFEGYTMSQNSTGGVLTESFRVTSTASVDDLIAFLSENPPPGSTFRSVEESRLSNRTQHQVTYDPYLRPWVAFVLDLDDEDSNTVVIDRTVDRPGETPAGDGAAESVHDAVLAQPLPDKWTLTSTSLDVRVDGSVRYLMGFDGDPGDVLADLEDLREAVAGGPIELVGDGEHNAELDYVVQRATIDGSPATITISNRDASTADVQIQITNR